MSYILDALKRAERDRHLAHVPTLATVHSSAHRTRPRWLWVGGGVLLVNAIVVMLLLRAGPVAGPTSTTSLALPAGAPATADVQKSAQPTATESSIATEPRTSRSTVDASVRPGTEASAPPRSTKQQGAQSTAPPPTSIPSDATAPRSAPTTTQSTFAALKLEMVVNADDPVMRAVYIGGRRYVTGQTLEHGAMIESIAPDAVVLHWAGQRYLLSWEHGPTPLRR
jgi:general secretion pathway protein B